MNIVKSTIMTLAASASLGLAVPQAAFADTYKIDDNTQGAHAFVQFRVKHLGYSWLYGRFNDFSGSFNYDPAKPEASSIEVTVDMNSVDSNHAERDKHIRSSDFLDVKKYPQASFKSTSFEPTDEGGLMKGELTFFGNTVPVEVMVDTIGGGKDPWGGYRQGFEATATIKPADFGLDLTKRLGPSTSEVELTISVEGVKQ
ncbi:YceI family protein [Kangiella sp. TOML190]|uniref:YceI family protein n=1 Tax=Kangiella sp. TOML190 TaxID=2931351 RepID=UPI00203FEA4E|nr:YceI family protein [Kangiella sp. TOML190]